MSLSLHDKPATPTLTALPPRPKQLTFPERVWEMLACFRSVHLAVVLLSLLALGTLAGVLLPQEGLVDTAEIKRSFGTNYRMLKAMGLFNVYSTYWFIAIEVLFFFNLLFGSFQWLKPAFLAATRRVFCGPEHIEASPHRLVFRADEPVEKALAEVETLLKSKRYRVFRGQPRQDGTRPLYASKGNFSRLGPVVAHFGILMMLVASVYGAFFGFKAQKLAVPGETFRIQDAQMFKPNVDEAVWLGSVPDWRIRVNDFRIEYYPEGQVPPNTAVVKQYYADLSVLDSAGKETKRETISVNHPLGMDDTMLYQASFNPTGKLFLTLNGKPVSVKADSTFMNRPVGFTPLKNGQMLMAFPFFVQQDPNVTRNYVVLFLRDPEGGFVGARPGKMPPNLRLLEGQSGQLNGMTFSYVKPEIATGLQIKKGPEVPWMYLSYIIIILGTIMCVFSQRRLWVAVVPDGVASRVLMLYKTNKARLSFLKELQGIQSDLKARRWTHE